MLVFAREYATRQERVVHALSRLPSGAILEYCRLYLLGAIDKPFLIASSSSSPVAGSAPFCY
jgi:hypothetical protein